MALPSRLRVVVPGGLVVGLFGLGATWLSVSSFFANPTLKEVSTFGLAVVAAPLFLLAEWAKRGNGSLSTTTLVFAIVAVAAVPAHPLFNRTWAAGVTMIGFIAWLYCILIVAGVPA